MNPAVAMNPADRTPGGHTGAMDETNVVAMPQRSPRPARPTRDSDPERIRAARALEAARAGAESDLDDVRVEDIDTALREQRRRGLRSV